MGFKPIEQQYNIVKGVYSKSGLYMVKSFSIFIVSIYYLIFSSLMSILINTFVPYTTEEELKNMSTFQLSIEISIIVGIVAVGYYLVRNLMSGGPMLFDKWFFEGWYGYKHGMLKEASTGGVIVGTVIFFFQARLRKRLGELSRRFTITAEATT